ncbi:MAG: ATP-binding protein [Myxococcota bacterium]
MPTILFLGDDPAVARDLRSPLDRLRYGLHVSPPRLPEAQRTAEELRPDLLLADARVPLSAEAGHHLRRALDLPLVMLAAGASDAEVDRARGCEPDGWVEQLDAERTLRGVLEVALRNRGARRGRPAQGSPGGDAHADRLAALGSITAALAHEINNPLTWVAGNLGLAIDALSGLKEAAESTAAPRGMARGISLAVQSLEHALQGSDRIRRIVADLRDFSGPDELDRRPVDVRTLVDTALRVCGNEVRHRAQVVREYAEVPSVRANMTQLGQVFLNLLVNAAQAIPAGRAEQNRIHVRVDVDRDGFVLVEVRDTGTGIAPEYLDRIFDPFFTTRPIGAGRGMGLSVAHGIVSDHGGEISVRSQVGLGSAFRVRLPAAPVPVEEAVDDDLAFEPGRRGRVLIVDDEPLVLDVLGKLLEEWHDVETCTSGAAALQLLLAGTPVDAVLCDLMMPDMTGMDIYEALARARPDVLDRIVFITGGAFTERATSFLQRVPNPRLEKPFEVQRLFSVLRRVVGP